MEGSLFDLAKAYLTTDVIQRASALVGESPANTQKAMDTAIPSIFAGLGRDAPGGAESARVLRILDDTGLRGTTDGITERLAADSGEDLIQLGKDLLGRIFGDRASAVVAATASTAGVKTSSMSSLLALAAPLALAALGREVHARKLDIRGLGAMLAQQKNAAETVLPRAVVDAVRGTVAPREGRAALPDTRAEHRGARFWPLLVLIPAVIIGALMLRKRPAAGPEDTTPRSGLGVGLPAGEAQKPASGEVDITLPGGEQVRLTEGSSTHALAVFLATPSAAAPQRFVLDDVVFDTASGELSQVSQTTIDQVAAMLNAYPSTHVLLQGHTDDTGDPAENARLSQSRADAVKAALVARGVAADRISTAGIGQERPLVPNDSAEHRAQNRRTEIVVTRK